MLTALRSLTTNNSISEACARIFCGLRRSCQRKFDGALFVVTAPEASSFYGFQIAMESIHSEVYSFDRGLCPDEQNELLDAVKTFPAIKKKADWVETWTLAEKSLSHRLVAFACVEGIFFSGSFAAIFWLKSRGYPLPGLYLSISLLPATRVCIPILRA